MYSVKIYGAGSIGNHLSNACRKKGWSVQVCDNDPEALKRMKDDIYPSRYGSWDSNIKLFLNSEIDSSLYFDVVVIGTPPESHIPIAISELKSENCPRLILIEKPLCTPDLSGAQELFDLAREKNVIVLCAFNHNLTKNTSDADLFIKQKDLGVCKSLHVQWLEHWGGIFKAHPWLDGPSDSYLGYTERGGGASCEHAHAVSIWQHFSLGLGMGDITEVTSIMSNVEKEGCKYDELSQMIVKTSRGLTGTIIQDVLTEPAVKKATAECENGSFKWEVNRENLVDYLSCDGEETCYRKTRTQDFEGEIDHVEEILLNNFTEESPISLERGLKAMMVISAAIHSSRIGKKVKIDYSKGFSTESFSN